MVAAGALILTTGGLSSSVIVTRAVASLIVALLEGEESVTLKVSLVSSRVSCNVVRLTVVLVFPAVTVATHAMCV